MKVGDLVRARSDLFTDKDAVSKDTIGIITKKNRTGQSSVTWVVKFPNTTYMTVFPWQELEVINES
tara:strand:- start:135 stop:332 length:198 start_codon:yes stop_codon:yes gene_type:complete